MAYCCVPLCKSDEKKKTPGLSFHEFPSDLALREKWIAAVRRDGWKPNDRSCYTKVCSRHFKKEDFIEGKRRRLKKGSVPSVFDDFPHHLQSKATRDRSTASIEKRAQFTCSLSTNASAATASTSALLPSVTSAEPPTEEGALMDTTPVSEPADHCDVKSNMSNRGVQVDCRAPTSLLTTERAKWKRKEKDLRSQILRLTQTVDKYKQLLKELKEDSLATDLSYIRQKATENESSALILLDQVRNFRKKRPTWSEETTRQCVVLRHLSTRAYEHMRGHGIFKLPGRKTLSAYIGIQNSETGFTELVEARLKAELENLKVPQSRMCSLIIDEMRIKEKLQYNKQQDCFVGQADMSSPNASSDLVLANSLLCFVISGLSSSYRIPVGYFFTKGLTGAQLHALTVFIMKKVESCGFHIIRLSTDNHKVNVQAMRLLGNGIVTYRTDHPCDPDRPLFMSFDPCHVLKNVRSQFLAHNIGPKGEISASYLKDVYELQKNLIVKPVRYLSRKHVFPNNIEKMNVVRAIQLISPAVTAVLQHLQEQAGHTCHISFASAGPTITFMENFYRWFVLHDTSNTVQHLRQRFPDVKQYDSTEDARLEWLEVTMPMYLHELKTRCTHPREFLTKETYEAFLTTTYSTVACIKHLLRADKFAFVLTRKFNSDPIESLFGTLRRSAGCNDALDVRAALSGLQKVLKIGIAASNPLSNVAHSEPAVMSITVSPEKPETSVKPHSQLGRAALNVLQRLNTTVLPLYMPSLQISATVYVGGYIVRVISEQINCENCVAIASKPLTNQPLQTFTRSQDRGGLLYPSDQLLFVLDILRVFSEQALKENPALPRPLTSLVAHAVPALCASKLLQCKENDMMHRQKLMELIAVRFVRPLLANYAFSITDKHDAYKYFAQKPLSRKSLKLR
ncbi:uncharacterized protein [Dermacentor andersoni]|uniref:uncharacterized protein n=1 Tax=Dermacentor andersoni TaxID=34620 RepID=UPI0021552FD1|nr:uncharacterized protein LOC126535549 [Dermacentor andersoni]